MEVTKWEKALVSLTPGGSEFAGDPDRCVQAVCDFMGMQHKQIVKLTMELKATKNVALYNSELLQSLVVMTALCRLKYGNLDEGVYKEILKAEEVINRPIIEMEVAD
jgi:hypothetical protein